MFGFILIASIYLGYVLVIAVYLHRRGCLFPSLHRARLQPAQIDADSSQFSSVEQELIGALKAQYIGQIESREGPAPDMLTRAYLSADRRTLMIVSSGKILGGVGSPHVSLYSFLNPLGQVVTSSGNPSVVTHSPYNFKSWLPESMKVQEKYAFHCRVIAVADSTGSPAKEVTAATALRMLQVGDELELSSRVRLGLVQRISNDAWRFTFWAHLLTAWKLAWPLSERNQRPHKQFVSVVKRIRRLPRLYTSRPTEG